MAWRRSRYDDYEYGYGFGAVQAIPETSEPVDPHLRYRATYASNLSGFTSNCRACYGPFDEGSLQLSVKIQVSIFFCV